MALWMSVVLACGFKKKSEVVPNKISDVVVGEVPKARRLFSDWTCGKGKVYNVPRSRIRIHNLAIERWASKLLRGIKPTKLGMTPKLRD